MATFGNREAAPMNSKPGEYILRVTGFEKGVAKGPKTSGWVQYELRLLVEKTGSRMRSFLVIPDEEVMDARKASKEFMGQQLDCFLMSTGVCEKDRAFPAFSFQEEEATESGLLYVPLLGLRGWAIVGYDDSDKNKERAEPQKYNKVVVWLTNKEKLPRHIAPAVQTNAAPPAPEAAAGNPDWS